MQNAEAWEITSIPPDKIESRVGESSVSRWEASPSPMEHGASSPQSSSYWHSTGDLSWPRAFRSWDWTDYFPNVNLPSLVFLLSFRLTFHLSIRWTSQIHECPSPLLLVGSTISYILKMYVWKWYLNLPRWGLNRLTPTPQSQRQ